MIFRKLHQEFTTLFLSLMLIAVMVVGWFALQQVRATVLAKGIQQMERELEEQLHQVQLFHSKMEASLRITLEHPIFKQYFSHPDTRAYIDQPALSSAGFSAEQQRLREELERWSLAVQRLFPLTETCVIDRTGREHSRIMGHSIAPERELSRTESVNSFFFPALTQRKGTVTISAPYVSDDSRRWVVAYTTPIVLDDDTVPGFFHSEIPLNQLRKLLLEHTHMEQHVTMDAPLEDRTLLLTAAGNVMVDSFRAFDATGLGQHSLLPTLNDVGMPQELLALKSMLLDEKGGTYSFQHDKRPFSVVVKRDTVTNWIMLHIHSHESIIANNPYLATTEAVLVIAALVLLLVTGLVLWYFKRRVTQPIQQISAAMQLIAKNGYVETMPVVGHDDFSRMVEIFNGMSQELTASYTQLGLERDKVTRVMASLEKAIVQANAATNAKSAFLAKMSHEIRSPMNAVIGMTDLVLESELTEEQRHYLEIVRQSGELLINLINEILDLSKIEAGRIELERVVFNPVTLVEEVCETLAVTAFKKELELVCSPQSTLPTALYGDPTRIRQVLINLCNNSIKFTKFGEIQVTVRPIATPEWAAHSEQAWVHFQVADTGMGIPADKLNSIFEEFVQADQSTSRNFGGTGLGLNIAKKLVELMGGRIWVESAEGSGSVFHGQIPFDRAEDKSPAEENPDFRGQRVVLVEPNQATQQLLTMLLTECGAEVVVTATGHDVATMMAATALETPPLYLLSHPLSDTTLEALSARLGAKTMPLSRVVVLARPTISSGERHQLKELGVAAVLLKPIKRTNVVRALQGVLGLAAVEEQEQLQVIKQWRCHPQTILLVDDNPSNQILAKDILQRHGHRVTLAEHGLEALELLATTPFDMVLMDIRMPVMDGIQATASIRSGENPKIDAAIPIAAVTANAMREEQEKYRAMGMNGYLAKPYKAEMLLELVFHMDELNRQRQPVVKAPPPMELLSDLVLEDGRQVEERRAFSRTIQGVMDQLATALKAGQFRAAEACADGLKRQAVTIGSPLLKASAFKIVLAARAADSDRCLKLYAVLEEEVAQVKELLQQTSQGVEQE